MTIKYLPVHFYCSFNRPTTVTTNLIFVLRSVLGEKLRKMCCASPKNNCKKCMFNKTCVYYSFFDTPIDKDNNIVKGRDTVSHPFAFTQNSHFDINLPLKKFDFTITLFGKGIEYLPYIYTAFVKAGQDGLFKNRTPFSINDVTFDNQSILNKNEIDTNIEPLSFSINPNRGEIKSGEVLVRLLSPLRYDIYEEIESYSFFRTLHRRMKTMMEMYGDGYEDCHEIIKEENNIKNTNIKLVSYERFSRRQEHSMEITGKTGSFIIKGNFSEFQLSLLDFASIANVGKSTNFGFGQIDYWTKF